MVATGEQPELQKLQELLGNSGAGLQGQPSVWALLNSARYLNSINTVIFSPERCSCTIVAHRSTVGM
jgi:hypothetical protein